MQSGTTGLVASWGQPRCSLQVVVIEKGRYTKAADLTLLERDAFQNMYEGCGLATTDDAGELWAYLPLPAAVTTQHPDLHLLSHFPLMPWTQAPCMTELFTPVQASISWLEQLLEEEPASTGMSLISVPAACTVPELAWCTRAAEPWLAAIQESERCLQEEISHADMIDALTRHNMQECKLCPAGSCDKGVG